MNRKPPTKPHRRPVRRRPGKPLKPKPRGFNGPGYSQLNSWILPGLEGTEKRQYYNNLSDAVVLAAGVVGAGLGFGCLGWLGGAVGLGAGIAAGGSYVEKQRYYRK